MIDWRDAAACRGLFVDMFFVNESDELGTGTLPNLGTMRRMCQGCPALEECREHAIKHEEFGFWAGTTAKERKRIRKQMGIRLDRPELAA